jgi:hypothetical protein
LIAALQARGVKGSMPLGILLTATVAWIFGLAHFSPGAYSLGDLAATAFKLDVHRALSLKGGIGLSLRASSFAEPTTWWSCRQISLQALDHHCIAHEKVPHFLRPVC